MQNLPDTSFIPQQPSFRVEGVARRREPLNLALIIALIAFFATLIVAGGVFIYHRQVVERVAQQSQKLEDAEELLNINEIESYKKVDVRITTAKNLIRGHNVFTTILKLLEKGTAQNVALTSLSYVRESKDLVLNISGEAPSYEAVYFQGETLKTMKPLVTNVEISGVTLDADTGIVNFTAKIGIDPESTTYSRLLEEDMRIRSQLEQATPATASSVTAPTP